jgi:hypothetical protein
MAACVNNAQLAAAWRAEADSLDRSAKAYRRSCVREKAMQNNLLAKQLRYCADQLDETTNAQAQSCAAESTEGTAAVAQDSPGAEADHGPSAAGTESQDQAAGQVQVSGVRSVTVAAGLGC